MGEQDHSPRERYALVLRGIYQDVLEVDPARGWAEVDKCDTFPQWQGAGLPWEEILGGYCGECLAPEDREVLMRRFSAPALLRMLESGRRSNELCFRRREPSGLGWAKLSALAEEGRDRVLVTLQDVSEQRMLQGIVERYVYQNCDCFIRLDAKRDAYVMLSGADAMLPPPRGCYSREAEAHTHRYVAPEDMEMVLREMRLSRVLEVLGREEEHSFFFGMLDPARGYTRKRLQFVYYDRENGILLLTRTDVTQVYLEEKARNDQLRRALEEARTDGLTGLYNHRAVRDLVSRSLNRLEGKQAALLFVDLDNFKLVNDTLGHRRGDTLLQSIARALREAVRPGDLIGRVGGDEFVVYLADMTDRKHIGQCAARICAALHRLSPREIGEALSGSVGVAVAPGDGMDYDTLRDKADRAMYQAKNRGKNQFVFYTPTGGPG